MIRLIVFDLDGVLVDAKTIHYSALNEALGTEFSISWNEHLALYDGLKTNEKLRLLTLRKGLPQERHEEIWKAKQKITLRLLSTLTENPVIKEAIKKLSHDEYKIACCSNSIRRSVLTMLSKLGIIEYMDLILGNEDAKNCKPHPEIYWKAISMMNCLPEETLIIEDSPFGLLAASRTNSKVMRVTSSKEVTYDNILKYLKQENMNAIPKWKDDKLNVIIPMAGAGSRFEKAGYTFPKPLIEVNGKPMIQVVIENLNIDANYIYVVQKSHREKYNLDGLLNLLTPKCTIIQVEGITQGAACTTLLAKKYINNDNPLFFANSDQYAGWNSNEFMYKMNETNADAGVLTFTSTHPKWSFVKINKNGLVTEVAEKNPISNIATVGFYYWKHGSDYVRYAEQMIEKNIRFNNEFYVCPVFNEAIKDKKEIRTFHIEEMFGLGTPEDLNAYLNRK